MRVAHFNMSQSGASCPQGLTQKNMSGLTLCGQNATGCQGPLFSALGLSYSRVCGQLRGYQFATVDAFNGYISRNFQLNQSYVDGASITYNTATPKHIWTYATGNSLAINKHTCPYNTGNSAEPPPFVGSDYYCETGNNAVGSFFPDDPL